MINSCKDYFETECFSIIINTREVILVRYDVHRDQSQSAHFYYHLNNYNKNIRKC